jgi:aryl-alcohol dehydrogenase-like predicted oxidoreductase
MSERPVDARRRALLAGTAGLAVAALGAVALTWRRLRRVSYDVDASLPARPPETVSQVGAMPYRRFGRTGLQVSEVSFGAWGIGGTAYGAVDRAESLRALARAEERGCNLVDTAMIYGDSELVLGEFLRTRRSRWIVATKYSHQPAGMTATLEQQLRRLGTDVIDFYQLHWQPPRQSRESVYDELYRLKKAGKVRFVGLSLYSPRDIDYVLDHTMLDGVQVPFSLLDPDPFLLRMERLRQSGLAVLIRSVLKEGFLTGNFKRDATFPDPSDQRHSWSAARIASTVDAVERFRFLAAEAGSMVRAAVAYPLSYPEVSTVLLGTKTAAQAEENFGQIPGTRLSTGSLRQVAAVQDELDAGNRRSLKALVNRLLRRS